MNIVNRFCRASDLLKAFHEAEGVRLSAPIDVDEIARYLKIKVVEDNTFDTDNIGEISFQEDGDQIGATVKIYAINNLQTSRRRFTLAHEIGHYCLHRSVGEDKFVDDRRSMSRTESYWDRYEAEANHFAAQLLMPKDLIVIEGKRLIGEFQELNPSKKFPRSKFIENLADLFRVSKVAMEYRLKNLGIIG